MVKRRITTISDELFRSFWDLYQHSYPAYEQRDLAGHELILLNPLYQLEVFRMDTISTSAFIACWEFHGYTYIEHMSVSAELRGQGVGSRILKEFLSERKDPVILEIDPVTDELSQKRLDFYSNAGFNLTPFEHIHPGYKKGDIPHSLLVLSYGRMISEKEFLQFRTDIMSML
ncbi:MAG: GNAT family N-acetyltransferase [Bacteroidota bacterium]|nr:GNAT family N-acetyltransferase [Bacteroidota bacterium]